MPARYNKLLGRFYQQDAKLNTTRKHRIRTYSVKRPKLPAPFIPSKQGFASACFVVTSEADSPQPVGGYLCTRASLTSSSIPTEENSLLTSGRSPAQGFVVNFAIHERVVSSINASAQKKAGSEIRTQHNTQQRTKQMKCGGEGEDEARDTAGRANGRTERVVRVRAGVGGWGGRAGLNTAVGRWDSFGYRTLPDRYLQRTR